MELKKFTALGFGLPSAGSFPALMRDFVCQLLFAVVLLFLETICV
jgi:hypothetical protein